LKVASLLLAHSRLSLLDRQQKRSHEQRGLNGFKERFVVRCLVCVDLLHASIATPQTFVFNVQN
jgi:hypothetical protein